MSHKSAHSEQKSHESDRGVRGTWKCPQVNRSDALYATGRPVGERGSVWDESGGWKRRGREGLNSSSLRLYSSFKSRIIFCALIGAGGLNLPVGRAARCLNLSGVQV